MRIKADTMMRDRDRSIDALAMLPDNVLLEVERRAQYDAANDGFSTGGSVVAHRRRCPGRQS